MLFVLGMAKRKTNEQPIVVVEKKPRSPISSEDFRCKPVLADNLTRSEVRCIRYFAIKLKEKRQTSTILTILSKEQPMPEELSHLKRAKVDGNDILVLLRSLDDRRTDAMVGKLFCALTNRTS